MSGVPTSFHLGPLVFHTYGFGLAIAAYVCYLYSRRRLSRARIELEPFFSFAVAVVVTGLIGARLANIATNWPYYAGHLGRWVAVWQGGLASFGGIALALPVAVVLQKRWWPGSSFARFADAMVPALVAGWALGRFLGPQFMVNGGGHLTHQWFGIHYVGQLGKRVPVPLIQGGEDGLLWGVLILVERKWTTRFAGALSALAMLIWGLARAYDEHWLLGEDSRSGSIGVQIAALVLALAGATIFIRHFVERRHV